MSDDFSTALAYFRPLLRVLDEAGQDSEVLLARHGLTVAAVVEGEGRVSAQVGHQLVDDVIAATGESQLWLRMLRHAEYTTFGGLGLALAAGGSVRGVLNRIVRYHDLISDAVDLSITAEDDRLTVRVEELSLPPPHPQSVMFGIAAVVGMSRTRVPKPLQLLEVRLRQADDATLAAARHFFRCPVEVGERYTVSFAAEMGELMLGGSDPEIAALLEQTLGARLAREQSPLSARLAEWLETHLPEGEPSLAEAARALHLSERSLQRRLRAERLTWSRLLDDTRRALVERHIQAPDRSFTELAFLLGFADVSSFSRAFRKWYGMTASQYRAKLRSGD